MRWTVLIPAKALPAAKSRLAGASADPATHARLVEAIRADTLAAVDAVPDAARVVLVTDREVARDDRHVLVQREPGLNPGLREAAEDARERWPDDGVAVLVADLPALRAAELAAVFAQAAGAGRGFVPDAEGTGTTVLTAAPGFALDPQFGAGSAARHAATATRLDAGPGLRRDVDTAADLDAAAALGLGPRTAAHLRATVDTRSSTSDGMMHGMDDAPGSES